MNEKSWDEFRKSGLLWFINTTLHLFGWAIVMEIAGDDEKFVRVFPARVEFRGFSEEANTDGYEKLSTYMKNNAEQLEKESKE